MTACLLASGIDPKRSVLFLQSNVPEHATLAWVIGCYITVNRLKHLPQWKVKICILVIIVYLSFLMKSFS